MLAGKSLVGTVVAAKCGTTLVVFCFFLLKVVGYNLVVHLRCLYNSRKNV